MAATHFILATAGHVDHGKSSLVKALTGTDPDRLPEEKARGITIDLGFAHLQLSAFDVGIVDVPGHEDFVKNMVAGVGSIDLALFIVAADDGWMPQTEEHLQILTYLGVTRAVVALTKIDLAQNEAVSLAALRDKLANTPFAAAPIVPTSIVSGRGIEELKQTLASVLADTPPPRDIAKPRLPVDRVFTLRGIGTVVTGTLIGGALKRGQGVVVQPGARAAKVRSLQNHSSDVELSFPGSRTAVNLPDVQGAAAGSATIERGEVITLAEFGDATKTWDVVLEKSPRLVSAQTEATTTRDDARPAFKTAAARPLKDDTLVRVHHGSGNTPARVHLLDAKQLAPGEHALAQLRFESPVYAFIGDRFIIRDWSEQATLAGGILLDPDASRRQFRSEPRRKFLQARAETPDSVDALARSQLARDGATKRAGLLAKCRSSAAEISDAVARAVNEKRALPAGEWLLDSEWWQAMQQKAAGVVDAAHKAHPDRPGLALSELRTAMVRQLPAPELFEPLVTMLCAGGFAQTGNAIRRASHKLALPPQLQAAGAKVRAALSAKPLDVPSRKELAPDALTQQALRFLVNSGAAVELSEDIVLLAEHFQRATDLVRQHIRKNGPSTTSDIRQALGTNRRVLIPLLERLDRDGITRRDGDKRVLKQP
ncbi:MAG: selenocysteine-specific translation elongation factor [Verrucomicrobia bacterium]|nr:selenocysteine-specific translation elongation factor [Verrucomicrobiota bacterium]